MDNIWYVWTIIVAIELPALVIILLVFINSKFNKIIMATTELEQELQAGIDQLVASNASLTESITATKSSLANIAHDIVAIRNSIPEGVPLSAEFVNNFRAQLSTLAKQTSDLAAVASETAAEASQLDAENPAVSGTEAPVENPPTEQL